MKSFNFSPFKSIFFLTFKNYSWKIIFKQFEIRIYEGSWCVMNYVHIYVAINWYFSRNIKYINPLIFSSICQHFISVFVTWFGSLSLVWLNLIFLLRVIRKLSSLQTKLNKCRGKSEGKRSGKNWGKIFSNENHYTNKKKNERIWRTLINAVRTFDCFPV